MTRLSTVLVGMSIALLNNAAFCQETAGIPDEIIKALDSLVGTWKIDGDIAGRKETGSYTCWWGRSEDKKKACLVGRFSYKSDRPSRSGFNVIGWNALKQCIEDRGFDANGGNATLFWTVKPGAEWPGEMIMVQNGKEVKSKEVLIWKGPSEIVVESKSETGEVARFVFTKMKEEDKQKAKR